MHPLLRPEIDICPIPMRFIVFKNTFVRILNVLFLLILIDKQFSLPAALTIIKISLIDLFIFGLHSSSVLAIFTILPLVRVLQGEIRIAAFAVDNPLQKTAKERRAVIPYEFALSMFFTLVVIALVLSFVVLFLASAMRLLVDPISLICKIRNLVSISSLIRASSLEVAGVGKHKEAKLKIRFEIPGHISLVIARKFPTFLNLINFGISFR